MNIDLSKLVAEVGLVTAVVTILIFFILHVGLKYIYERELEKMKHQNNTEIESMRRRWDVMLESVKVRAETEKMAYHKQYEKEYASYEVLWTKLHNIEQMMELLTGVFSDAGKDALPRRKHICNELVKGFAAEVQLYKPFYDTAVFQNVCLVSEALCKILTRLENDDVVIDYASLGELKDRMELLCVSIQDRIFLRYPVSEEAGHEEVQNGEASTFVRAES